MEPYTAIAALGRGRADGLDVGAAPVHGPRRPRALLRPAARPRSGSSSPTSAAATAASRTPRSSRSPPRSRCGPDGRCGWRCPSTRRSSPRAATPPPSGSRDRVRRARATSWPGGRRILLEHRRLCGELAAGRPQGGQPARRPVPDPGARRHLRTRSTRTPRRRARSAASGRRRSPSRASRSWTRRPSGWASTRWRSGAATCCARASAPWPRVRGHRRGPGRGPRRSAAEELGLGDAAGRRGAAGRSASPPRMRDRSRSRPPRLRVHADGSVTVMCGQHGDRPGLVDRARPDRRRRDGRARSSGSTCSRATPPPSPTTARPAPAARPRSWASPSAPPPPTRGAARAAGPRKRWPPTGRRSSRSATASGSATSSMTGARSCVRGSAAPAARSSGAATSAEPARRAEMPPFWEIGCVGVEVSVDEETGQDPRRAAGHGGRRRLRHQPAAGRGTGRRARRSWASAWRPARSSCTRTATCSTATCSTIACRVRATSRSCAPILVERGDGVGVYGAKGGGEGALNPVAAAIAKMLGPGDGCPAAEAPFTPERAGVRFAQRDALRLLTIGGHAPAGAHGPGVSATRPRGRVPRRDQVPLAGGAARTDRAAPRRGDAEGGASLAARRQPTGSYRRAQPRWVSMHERGGLGHGQRVACLVEVRWPRSLRR